MQTQCNENKRKKQNTVDAADQLREEEIRDELTKVLLSNQAPQIEQNEAILVFSEGSS